MDETRIAELFDDEKIVAILKQENPKELAKVLGRLFHDFSEQDERYLDLFWDAAFNKSWLYVSEEMVSDMFGYSKGKNMMTNFYVKLVENYEEFTEYKQVDETNEFVRTWSLKFRSKSSWGGSNKKYFIITGETVKSLAQTANTQQGKHIRKYFIKVESLCVMTNTLIFRYLLREKTLENTKLERKAIAFESFLENAELLRRDQIFYLATSPAYARNNRFKFGGCKDAEALSGRLASYNTGRAEGDLFYYTRIFPCNNYRLVEDKIKVVLRQFLDKRNSTKELLHLRYNRLLPVVELMMDHIDNEIEYINERCKEMLRETVEEDAVVPEPVDFQKYLPTRMPARISQALDKVNVAEWPEEKINELAVTILNQAAARVVPTYDFTTQKHTTPVQLDWTEITTRLDGYAGYTKTGWRALFKNFLGSHRPSGLRVRGLRW